MIFPEQYRITPENAMRNIAFGKTFLFATAPGGNGAFLIPKAGHKSGAFFFVIASNGEGWDHVSVTIPSEKRCPTWEEMCYIKDLFWAVIECVVQYHPPESEYISNHKYCLHLWKPLNQLLPIPDKLLVGLPDISNK